MNKEQLDAMARRIKEKRMFLGLTQEQTAEKLKISYSSYTKIENGFQNPSLDTLIGISTMLKMSLDEMVFGVDENSVSTEIRALESVLTSYDKEKLAYAVEVFEKIVSCL